LDKHL